jgi:P4 family phage/plasmid primase-like protien
MGKFNNEIAMGLARLYGDNHVFSRGTWYYFNGSKWVNDENQTFISRTIMTTFHDRLNEEIRTVSQVLGNMSSDHPRFNEENARMKNLTGIKEKTQSGRINSDWHALNVAFDQPTFEATLDSFQNLIAFENGVYDLELDQFVEPQREHRTTMSTNYDYVHTYDIPQKDYDELDELLRQIFPDEHILHYMLRFLGSCLSGYVNEELIHFWTGMSNKQTGSNGKSTFVSLLLLAFGDYASCGHSSIITSRRENSNSTNSALMSLKGKRLVTFQEIDNENAINMPVIKSLTGNDQITGRQLYKTQETFTPQWKLVVCANRLPPVSSDDGGTQRCLCNIPFESKFVKNTADPK